MLIAFKHLKKLASNHDRTYLIEDIYINVEKIISIATWVPPIKTMDTSQKDFCMVTGVDGKKWILQGSISQISEKMQSRRSKGLLNG